MEPGRMNALANIKQLRQLTNGGLAECKHALDAAGGDVFLAAVSMLTEDDVKKMQQAMMNRELAGQSIADPVTPEEKELVERLAAHFVAQRTRPAHANFLFELTGAFYSDCLLYTSPSPRDRTRTRMPSSA